MNNADRILDMVKFFSKKEPTKPMHEAWSSYLGLSSSGDLYDVVQLSSTVLAEVRLLDSMLSRMGVPADAYKYALENLKSAWSPTQLNSPWSNFKDGVTSSGLISVLNWASWSIRDRNEMPISEDLLSELYDKLEEQEELLNDVNLPPSIYEMLHRHVEELSLALRFLKITGVKPVVDTVHRQMGEMSTAPKEVIEELDRGGPVAKSVFKSGIDLILSAGKVADSASKITKFAGDLKQLSQSAWGGMVQLIDYLPKDPPA